MGKIKQYGNWKTCSKIITNVVHSYLLYLNKDMGIKSMGNNMGTMVWELVWEKKKIWKKVWDFYMGNQYGKKDSKIIMHVLIKMSQLN